ncbi:Uncharacterized protein HZ326_17635 [Fusarium oxysporum f. sp. albedinis]|nr:Uncharacterized protein HZ326_17635 [Fusarium oxysporum f. sp. albedinis]
MSESGSGIVSRSRCHLHKSWMPGDSTPLKEEAGVGDNEQSAVAASLQPLMKHRGAQHLSRSTQKTKTLENCLLYLSN